MKRVKTNRTREAKKSKVKSLQMEMSTIFGFQSDLIEIKQKSFIVAYVLVIISYIYYFTESAYYFKSSIQPNQYIMKFSLYFINGFADLFFTQLNTLLKTQNSQNQKDAVTEQIIFRFLIECIFGIIFLNCLLFIKFKLIRNKICKPYYQNLLKILNIYILFHPYILQPSILKLCLLYLKINWTSITICLFDSECQTINIVALISCGLFISTLYVQKFCSNFYTNQTPCENDVFACTRPYFEYIFTLLRLPRMITAIFIQEQSYFYYIIALISDFWLFNQFRNYYLIYNENIYKLILSLTCILFVFDFSLIMSVFSFEYLNIILDPVIMTMLIGVFAIKYSYGVVDHKKFDIEHIKTLSIQNRDTGLYFIHYILGFLQDKTKKLSFEEELYMNGLLQQHETECQKPDCFCKGKIDQCQESYSKIQFVRGTKQYDPEQYKLLQYVKELYEELLQRNFRESWIFLAYSEFCYIYMGNYSKAIHYLILSKNKAQTLYDRLFFNILLMKIQTYLQQWNEKIQRETFDEVSKYPIIEPIQIELLFEQFIENFSNSLNSNLQFWECLAQETIIQAELENILRDNERNFDQFQQNYEEINKITSKHIMAIQIYGIFQCLILNDITSAKYLEKSFNLYAEKQKIRFVDRWQDKLQEMMSNGSCIMRTSSSLENFCKITFSNKYMPNVFGLKPEEVIGSSVNKLIPKVIAQNHEKWIRESELKGDTYIMMKQRKLVARHNYGNTFPIKFIIRPWIFLEQGLEYLIFAREIRQIKELILTDEFGSIDSMSRQLYDLFGLEPFVFHFGSLKIQAIIPELKQFYEKIKFQIDKGEKPYQKFEATSGEMEIKITKAMASKLQRAKDKAEQYQINNGLGTNQINGMNDMNILDDIAEDKNSQKSSIYSFIFQQKTNKRRTTALKSQQFQQKFQSLSQVKTLHLKCFVDVKKLPISQSKNQLVVLLELSQIESVTKQTVNPGIQNKVYNKHDDKSQTEESKEQSFFKLMKREEGSYQGSVASVVQSVSLIRKHMQVTQLIKKRIYSKGYYIRATISWLFFMVVISFLPIFVYSYYNSLQQEVKDHIENMDSLFNFRRCIFQLGQVTSVFKYLQDYDFEMLLEQFNEGPELKIYVVIFNLLAQIKTQFNDLQRKLQIFQEQINKMSTNFDQNLSYYDSLGNTYQITIYEYNQYIQTYMNFILNFKYNNITIEQTQADCCLQINTILYDFNNLLYQNSLHNQNYFESIVQTNTKVLSQNLFKSLYTLARNFISGYVGFGLLTSFIFFILFNFLKKKYIESIKIYDNVDTQVAQMYYQERRIIYDKIIKLAKISLEIFDEIDFIYELCKNGTQLQQQSQQLQQKRLSVTTTTKKYKRRKMYQDQLGFQSNFIYILIIMIMFIGMLLTVLIGSNQIKDFSMFYEDLCITFTKNQEHNYLETLRLISQFSNQKNPFAEDNQTNGFNDLELDYSFLNRSQIDNIITDKLLQLRIDEYTQNIIYSKSFCNSTFMNELDIYICQNAFNGASGLGYNRFLDIKKNKMFEAYQFIKNNQKKIGIRLPNEIEYTCTIILDLWCSINVENMIIHNLNNLQETNIKYQWSILELMCIIFYLVALTLSLVFVILFNKYQNKLENKIHLNRKMMRQLTDFIITHNINFVRYLCKRTKVQMKKILKI